MKPKLNPTAIVFRRMQKEREQRQKKLSAMPIDELKAYIRKTIVLHRETQIQERTLSDLLNDMHKCCPHDEGIVLPHLDGMGYARPRDVYCSICHDAVGRYCKENPTHFCEYNWWSWGTPDKKARGYHDCCIHCGKLWEE